jgi:arylsulfatase A-like enzyme
MLRLLLAAVVIFLMAPSRLLAQDAKDRRPNVLFILTDDQRHDALSLAGHPHLKTPHTDRLAQEGIHFKNAFCTTSICSPSRASILSGLYAHTHGVTNNFTEYPEAMPTWPKALQTAGYKTAYVGKYHMGEDNDDVRGGFDWFVTHKGQGKYFDTEFRFHGKERRVVEGYYTTVVTDMALDWLQQCDEPSPWALIIGHKAPHSFYYPEPKYADAFDHVSIRYPRTAFMLADKPEWFKLRLDTWHGIYGPLFDYRKDWPDRSPEGVAAFADMERAYWGTILSVDDSVGRLYEFLQRTGQLDNTLIVYTSDNGILSGEHGMIDKRTMHEPSIRIPVVVRYPGLTPPDQPRVVRQQVLTLDFAPSIIDLCGAEQLPKTHGKSWKAIAGGEDSDWRTAWFYEYNYEKQFPYTPNVRGVRTDRYKYIRYPHGDGGPDRHMAELYDVQQDPEETTNLIHDPKYAAIVETLGQELHSLMAASDALPDKMPIDAGIGTELPDAAIR